MSKKVQLQRRGRAVHYGAGHQMEDQNKTDNLTAIIRQLFINILTNTEAVKVEEPWYTVLNILYTLIIGGG